MTLEARPQRKKHGKGGTLIGMASRALFQSRRNEDAWEMQTQLLRADPADWLAILSRFVDFWPSTCIQLHPMGDPVGNFSRPVIPYAQMTAEERARARQAA